MVRKYLLPGITVCAVFGFYLCSVGLPEYSNLHLPVHFPKKVTILASYHAQNDAKASNAIESSLISTTTLKSPTIAKVTFNRTTYFSSLQRTKKLILLWNGFYNKVWPFEILKEDILFANCKYKCQFTRNRSFLNKSDAVIFEGLPINTNDLPIRTPNLQNQVWIFQRVESPLNAVYNSSIFDGLINWTMTYRRDSDILWPAATYGIINTSVSVEPIPPISSAVNKTKFIAWMNSHCNTPSLRENIVTQLEKYIEIHDYGNCSKNSTFFNCNINHGYSCYKKLGKQYKFWLVFENSICKDYVSEKLWEALRSNMVPIVYGHSQTLKDIAIPGSYIDIMKYKSIKELAKYLLYLHENDEEYLKYMEWKKIYRILSIQENVQQIACNLCTKLYELSRNYYYESIHKWFNTNITTNEFQCNIPTIDKDGRLQLWSARIP